MAIFDNELIDNVSDRTPEGPKQLLPSPTVRNVDVSLGGFEAYGNPSSGKTGLSIDQLSEFSGVRTNQSSFSSPMQMVPRSELLANQRYSNYQRGVDLENVYGLNQSWYDQLGNGIVKMGGLGVGTFLQSFATIPNTMAAIKNGKLSDLSGGVDGYEASIDNWTKNLEDIFPNYYTREEQKHPYLAMLPFAPGSANFWGDKVIKNLGFTAGAIGGAVVQDAAIGLVTEGIGAVPLVAAQLGKASLYLNKIFAGTNNVEKALDVAKAAGVAADTILDVKKLGDIAAYTKVTDGFRYGMALYGSARTEAAIEARDSYRTVREDLLRQYKIENAGVDPTGEDAEQIEDYATSAMNTRFGINMALLTASNAIQFGNLFKSFTSANKAVSGQLTRELEDLGKIGLKEGSKDVFEAKVATGLKDRIWESVRPKMANILVEGVYEEGGQYAAEKGVYDYYTRKYKNLSDPKNKETWNETNEIVNSTLTGLKNQFGTSEGLENMMVGAISALITGGIMGRIDAAKGEGKEARLQSSINLLNQYGLTGILSNQYDNTLSSAAIAKEMDEAAKTGDIFKYKNLKNDMFFNFVQSRIPSGMHDVTIEQLNMLKDLDKAEFEKSFGMDFNSSNKSTVNEYVDSLINEANQIKKISDSIDFTFKNPFKKIDNPTTEEQAGETMNFMLFNQWKTELTYLAAKVPHVNNRLSSVQESVSNLAPAVTNELLAQLTNKELLKDLSASYEQRANQLNKTITDFTSPQDRKNIKDQVKALRTASERINIGLKDGVDNKLFDYLLNFELNNQDPKADRQVGPENSVDLFTYGHDINRLNVLKDRVVELYDKLTGEEGFNKFMEQGEQLRSGAVPEEEVVEVEKAPEFTNKGGEKENVAVGREYQVPEGRKARLDKVADDRWQVTSPDGTLTFYSSEEKAQEQVDSINEELGNLQKVKVVNINDDGTVKVEDINGDIYDIDPSQMEGYERIQTEQEKLQRFKEDLDIEQTDVEKTSGDVATGDPTEYSSKIVFEDKKKGFSELYISEASASEDWEADNLKPQVVRKSQFLNNFKNLPNKNRIKVILLTQNQEKALGLEGFTESILAGTGIDPTQYTSVTDGLVATVYVEQDGNDYYFVDVNGERIGKVGDKTDVQKVVSGTMPTTSLYWSNGEPRYRKGEDAQAIEQSKRWEAKRQELFDAPNNAFEVYDFSVSRGFPVTGEQSSAIGNNIIPEDKIATQEGLVVISTTGSITHQGKSLKFPKGVPVLQYDDTLYFANTRKFNNNEATAIFEVIKRLGQDVKRQADANKKIKLNRKYTTFLQNVLYFRKSSDTQKNQMFIDTDEMSLFLGGDRYDITDIASKENDIIAKLKDVYANINNDTLTKEFNSPFTEYYMDGDKLSTREWTNYQSYLVSSKGPDGGSRGINNIPLTTKIVPPSETVPYNFKQKYSVLQGIELPQVKIEKPVEADVPKIGEYVVDGKASNTFNLKNGPVEFTASLEDDNVVVNVEANETIDAVAANAELMTSVVGALKAANQFDATKNDKELAAQYVALRIATELEAIRPKAEVAQLEAPTEETKPKEKKLPPNTEYRRVGAEGIDRISDAELELFKQWHAQNAAGIPYEITENILITHDGEKAWGAFEQGVAKFYKSAARGTEYHEIFEGVWKGFLSDSEKQAILDEFKAKSGEFTDRQSGKKIAYADATDTQAKERIADDFADFRLGKLPARSIGERILRFFKSIIEFVKQFVNKPSRKEELFKAIDTGRFKEKVLPESVKNDLAEYRAVEGLNEQETHEYVQDMTARVFQILFRTNQSLFNPEKFTGAQIFSEIKEAYEEEGKMDRIGDNAWNQLVKKTTEFLRTFKIEFNEDDIVSINDENYDNRNYAPEPFSTNWKKSSPYPVKLLLATLTETAPTNQSNATSLKLPAQSTSSVEGYKLLNFSRAFATVLDKLSNTNKVSKFVEKLIDLAKNDSNYVRLFTRLKGDRENLVIDFSKFQPHDLRMFVNFYQTFTKQNPTALIQYVSDGQVYTKEANLFTAVKDVQNGWIENIKALANDPKSIITYDRPSKSFMVKSLADVSIKFPQDKVAFLKNIGVDFPMETYVRLKKDQADKFDKAVESIYAYVDKAKGIASVTGKTLGIDGQLKTLAQLSVKVTNPIFDSTHFNVEDKRTQTYTDSNAASVFENDFNEVESLDELLKLRPELTDVFSKNSVILKKGGVYFDKDGKRTAKKIKVSYIQGTKDIDTGKGTPTSRLSLRNSYVQGINQNLNGNYYILVPADGSTEWMMSLGNHFDFADVESGDAWATIYSIFRGYLKDDIAIAKSDRKYIRNTKPRAQELRFFKDILPANILRDINNMIINNETQEAIDRYVNENTSAINDAVKVYIESNVNDTITSLKANGAVVYVSANESAFVNLDTEFAQKEGLNPGKLTDDELKDVVTFANTNYIINNIEYHKTLFGDPYQFKIQGNQLDETKRIKSFLSPRRVTVDFPEFNTRLNQMYNVAGDIQLTSKDPGHHTFKPYVNTVTVDDVEFDGVYKNNNEADAASWIMDGAYREVKLKNGQWPDEAEAWHQHEMAYTRLKLSEKGLYKYTNPRLREQDVVESTKPSPKFVTEELKPIVSGNKYDKNNFDVVLDKFSQMPLYYSSVEGTNLEKLYLKMWKENVGYAVMISGRKVGAENLHKLYNEDGSFNDAPFNNNIKVPWKAYGIQVENAYDGPKEQTRGSQLTKLSSLDLFDNGEASVEAKKEYERNKKILKLMHENAYKSILSRLGIVDLGDSFELVDEKAVSETLEYEMLKRELSDNAKDTVQLDENGNFRVPFESSPAYLQIRNILFSIADKSLVSPKMSGGAHVQVPVTLWESGKRDPNKANPTLKFYTKEQPYMEVMIPKWFKGKFKSKEEQNKIMTGIGFRIPTQALSSAEVFKVKDFLPESMGATVVVPSEITGKAGSDFDIDKLNMYLKATYVDKDGYVRLVEYKGSEEATKEFYANVYDELVANDMKEAADSEVGDEDADLAMKQRFVNKMYKSALENEYYDSLEKMLTLPENYDRLIAPVGDAGLKKVSEKLDGLRNEDEGKIKNRLLDRNYMTRLRNAFVTGKKWVGIAAVNITGQSLTQKEQIVIDPAKFDALETSDQKFLRDGTIALPHNEIDGKISISGKKTADGSNQFISDRLSGYATSFVDIAKDPYIMKIIQSDLAVGTFMFLERVGAGEYVPLFMNQPIISEYLKYLDSIGATNLFTKKNIDYIESKFPAEGSEKINVNNLGSNISDYYTNKLTTDQNAEQLAIFREFLKYAKMAEFSFDLTQASNYDTTKFSSSDSLFKKQVRTEMARQKNIFSSVDKLLDASFIGDQSRLLAKVTEAIGEILKLDSYRLRYIVNSVLRPYAANKYLSADKYDRIGNKLTASFLDYIIQTKAEINNDIKSLLIDKSSSVASKLAIAKKNHPEVKILKDLEPVSSDRVDGAVSIKLKANLKDAYDENLYTGYMRELRDNPDTRDLYYDVVILSLLQGTYQSAISIKNIVPIEDYSEVVAPIIKTVVADEDLEAFANGMFQRNNWKDDSIWRTVMPKFFPGELPLGEDVYGNEIYQFNSPAFPGIQPLAIKPSDRKIMVLSETYNYLDTRNDFILVPRVVEDAKTGDKIDMENGKTVTNRRFVEAKNKGDLSLRDVYGYQKVKLADGSPLTYTDGKGNVNHVYKLVNLLGDGQYASEYYKDFRPSVINNGTVKVANEIPDADIIQYFAPAYVESDSMKLRDGGVYKKEDIDSQLLSNLGYNPIEIGNILKSIC